VAQAFLPVRRSRQPEYRGLWPVGSITLYGAIHRAHGVGVAKTQTTSFDSLMPPDAARVGPSKHVLKMERGGITPSEIQRPRISNERGTPT